MVIREARCIARVRERCIGARRRLLQGGVYKTGQGR